MGSKRQAKRKRQYEEHLRRENPPAATTDDLLEVIKAHTAAFIERLRDPKTRIAALRELCEADERARVKALHRELDDWNKATDGAD